ncbi:hypothetical protein TURU_161307 [Turdus rufiventris]|nr:hypothetical protein TURU_161307 [Turdus rufiventris]
MRNKLLMLSAEYEKLKQISMVTNKKPAQASITKVKQFEGSTSFVRRTQWMLEQLRQVNGIDPNRDSPEFDLLFENAFDQWVANTASEKCTFFQVLHHTCQRYLTDKKPEFINCQSKLMGGNSILHSAADSVTSAVQKASQALNERGERLGRAEEKTEELKNSAQQFAETAHKKPVMVWNISGCPTRGHAYPLNISQLTDKVLIPVALTGLQELRVFPFNYLNNFTVVLDINGLVLDENLKKIWQCVLPAQKAKSILGCIQSSVASSVREGGLPLCSALVKSCLECCTLLWGLQHKKDMDLLEQVQGRATKSITGLEPCEDRLSEMGLHKLERRRFWGDLTESSST